MSNSATTKGAFDDRSDDRCSAKPDRGDLWRNGRSADAHYATVKGRHLTRGWAEPVRRLAGRRDVGVRRGRTDVVRRERETEPSSRNHAGPAVLPTPHGVHEV